MSATTTATIDQVLQIGDCLGFLSDLNWDALFGKTPSYHSAYNVKIGAATSQLFLGPGMGDVPATKAYYLAVARKALESDKFFSDLLSKIEAGNITDVLVDDTGKIILTLDQVRYTIATKSDNWSAWIKLPTYDRLRPLFYALDQEAGLLRKFHDLINDEKLSDVSINLVDDNVTSARFMDLSTQIVHRPFAGDIAKILEGIESETIELFLDPPTYTARKFSIALMKGPGRGIYEVQNYDGIMSFEIDPKSPVEGAYRIVGTGTLAMTSVLNFHKLEKDHPKSWMAIVGYEINDFGRISDQIYVLCYQSDEDPILDLYRHYLASKPQI